MNVDQFDTEAFRTDKLELTSGNIADHNGNVVSGVFDIHSSDYVLNADLVNDRTWDTSKSNYGYGIVAMNSDGHLTINGNGDVDNGTELDNSSVDNVVAATGNYKVRIDNATGAGAIADYKDKEIIYVNDVNSNATFSAANKADLGAYTYQAEQRGNTVVLQQMELTDYANMALSIPSANTNIWNLEQDTVGTRLTNWLITVARGEATSVVTSTATTVPSTMIRMLTASWSVLIPKLTVTTLSGSSVRLQASLKVT